MHDMEEAPSIGDNVLYRGINTTTRELEDWLAFVVEVKPIGELKDAQGRTVQTFDKEGAVELWVVPPRESDHFGARYTNCSHDLEGAFNTWRYPHEQLTAPTAAPVQTAQAPAE